MSKVFLSHSSRDATAAIALKTWLEKAEPGLLDEIFLDLDVDSGIPAGVRWKEALKKANDRCEAVICLVSRNWDDSHECLAEYRNAEDRGKPIFPVRLEPTSGSDITREWQRCDLFGDGPKTVVQVKGEPVEFHTEGLVRLQKGLRAIGIAPDSFAWPPPDDPDRSPYRGWQPLEAVDAAVYFGRDAEINRALTAIRALRSSGEKRAFTILGPSGVGKSSFLRAGLLPRLRRDDRHFLTMQIVRPERYPLTGDSGLAKSVYALRTSLGLNQPGLGAIKAGVGDSQLLRGWLAEAENAALERFVNGCRPTAPTLILPVDQAEELFGADVGAEADEFLTVVSELLKGATPDSPIMAVSTIRSDRYELFQTAPQRVNMEAYVFEDLRPMPPDRFREVICGPAARAQAAGHKLQWAPEVVERLIQACDSSADALPLLSLTLARLYEDYSGDGEISLEDYESMGGMSRVVESVVGSLLSDDRDARQHELEQLRRAFIPWLATIAPIGDVPLRRVARWFDLPADSHRLMDALVAKRLLVKDERDGEVVVEVALESLLRQWDTLAQWLREEATDLKGADALDQAARAWVQNGFKDDWLLEGARLTDAEALAAKSGFRDRLNNAREFLLASKQREDQRAEAALRAAQERHEAAMALAAAEGRAKQDAQRRARVLRSVLVVTVVIAVLAVVCAGWAIDAKNQAHERLLDATAERLRADSQARLAGQSPNGNDDALAMQLLLAAHHIRPNAKADFQLLTVLNQERDLLKLWDTPARVYSVGLSPNGRRILAGSADTTIKLWDAVSGNPIGEPLRGHNKLVTSVAFSPDGTRIASGSADNTIRQWDAATGHPIGAPMRYGNAVTSVAFSPDGTEIVSGSIDSNLQLWDAVSGQPIGKPLSGNTKQVTSVAFSRDGTRIASGSADSTIALWDAVKKTQIGTLVGHKDAVISVAFSPDGTRIASGSKDNTIRLWDVIKAQPIGQPLFGHQGIVYSVAFSPDGARIASGSEDKTILLWDAAGHPIGEPLRGHYGPVYSVAFSPDSLQVVSAGEDSTVRLWDASRWQPILAHEDTVQHAVLRADGQRIVASGDDDIIRSWDTVTGRPIGNPVPLDADQPLIAIDSGLALKVDHAGAVQLWDIARVDGRQPSLYPTPISKPLPGPGDPKLQALVAYSPAGKVAVPVTADTVQLYKADTAQPLGRPIMPGGPVTAIAFTPDGSQVATGDANGTVRLWDAGTGTSVGSPMTGDGPVTNLAFSIDAHTLSWSEGRALQLWNVEKQTPIRKDMKADAIITAVAIGRDGQIVAAGGQDGGIWLWNIHDGKRLPPLVGQSGAVTSLDFDTTVTRLLSASTNGTVRVWPIVRPSPEALCAKLTSNMSAEQWHAWVSADIGYTELCAGLPQAQDNGQVS
jgi:WD40 repeat protein